MKIVVTHNPITRLIFKTLLNTHERSTFLRIETRPSKPIKSDRYATMYADCNSNQTPQTLLQFAKAFKIAQINLTNKDEKCELYIPHHNNDLYWLLSENPMVTELYYIEEGDGSLHKERSHPIRMEEIKKPSGYTKLPKEYSDLEQYMRNNNYEEDSCRHLLSTKGNSYPSFVKHKKYKGSIHISQTAFSTFAGRRNIKEHIRERSIKPIKNDCIFYLPSRFTKAPWWIRTIDNEGAKHLANKALELIIQYQIKHVVLKRHPSTNEKIVNIIRKTLSSKARTYEWGEFLDLSNLSDEVEEAATIKFQYAIFSCKSSAISYTRALSPKTELLFTNCFSNHIGEIG